MNYCTTSYRRSKLDSQYEYTSTEYANKTHRVTTLQPSSSFKALSFSACGLALGPRLRRISFSQLRTFRPLVTYRPNEKTKSVAFRIDSSFSKFSAYYRTNPSFEYSTYGSCTVQYSIVCTFEVT